MSEEVTVKQKELAITVHSENDVQIALLENGKLVEIQREKSSQELAIGDVYYGKVKKFLPALNAAFVNIGSSKEAFLHYLDLGEHTRTLNSFTNQVISNCKKSIAATEKLPVIEKKGKITDVLNSGDHILVQVVKEEISTKGARISTEISLAGRYVVLVPFNDRVSVSLKIKSYKERKRLKQIATPLKPKAFGLILRTTAQGKTQEELDADLQQLMLQWKNIVSILPEAEVPSKVFSEMDRTLSIIRDMFNDDFEVIYVDDKVLYKKIKNYIASFAKEKKNIVKYYNKSTPLYEELNIAKQIKGSFGKVVTIKNGIYLVIEHTEAMHVIDVNSGKRSKTGITQEENAIAVNLEAATEIARQLRLRDMGGIITIDFIDMAKASNKTLLFKTLQELMKDDKAKHTILPVNKFGLIQITRQRVRQATVIETLETCPVCLGSGKVKASLLLDQEIENMIEYLLEGKNPYFYLKVHPFVHAYLTKGFFSTRWKWLKRYKRWIKIVPEPEFSMVEFKFYNASNEQIAVWEPVIQQK